MSDKIRKLSQAMRLGATFTPQARGYTCKQNSTTGINHTCAIGAAYHGAFGEPPQTLGTGICWAELMKRFKMSATYDNISLQDEIVMMNDEQRLTREQIADWLEKKGL